MMPPRAGSGTWRECASGSSRFRARCRPRVLQRHYSTRMRAWVIVMGIAACGSKKTEQAPAVAVKTGSGSGSAVAATHPKPPPPTKEQRAEFRKRMKAGWALQKESKWADAVPEFEAALVALPGDQRALTELGFSAMNAGDFVKARKADQEAILVA